MTSYRFQDVKTKIEHKYEEIEVLLREEFLIAQRKEDLKRMKEIATILSQFKGYSKCIDAFIEQSQAVNTFNV